VRVAAENAFERCFKSKYKSLNMIRINMVFKNTILLLHTVHVAAENTFHR